MNIFQKGAKTAFKVAKKLGVVKTATFKSVYNNGFESTETIIENLDVIREGFTQDDIRGLMFRDKIQPTDIKLIVLGTKIEKIDTDDIFTIESVDYTVFGCTIDAANAAWIVGVR